MAEAEQSTQIALFKGKKIRKTIHDNQWWFSVVDVIEALTDSGNKKIHHEEKEEHEEKTSTNAFEIVCLAERILKAKPQKFTCLDTAFKNNDQLKTNTALQAEAAKIEFKVI